MCLSNIGDLFKPHKWFRGSNMPQMPTIEIPKSRPVAPLPQLAPLGRGQPQQKQDIQRFSSGLTPTIQQILGLAVPSGIGLMTPGGDSRG